MFLDVSVIEQPEVAMGGGAGGRLARLGARRPGRARAVLARHQAYQREVSLRWGRASAGVTGAATRATPDTK